MTPNELTPDLAAFIEAQTSIFLATASANGQPHIQHRGPPEFLRAEYSTTRLPATETAVLFAPRGQDRHVLSWLRPANLRNDFRGQYRPDSGGQPLRTPEGLRSAQAHRRTNHAQGTRRRVRRLTRARAPDRRDLVREGARRRSRAAVT